MLNNDPVRTPNTDRWRVTFSEAPPEGAWRETLLAKAQATPEGRGLQLSFEDVRWSFAVPTRRTQKP